MPYGHNNLSTYQNQIHWIGQAASLSVANTVLFLNGRNVPIKAKKLFYAGFVGTLYAASVLYTFDNYLDISDQRIFKILSLAGGITIIGSYFGK